MQFLTNHLQIYKEMRRTFRDGRFNRDDVWEWFCSQEETLGVMDYKEKEARRRRDLVLQYKTRRVPYKADKRIQFDPSVQVKTFRKNDRDRNTIGRTEFVKLKL